MTDSTVVTEEPLRERSAEVMQADGPEPQVSEDDAPPPSGQPDAAADEPDTDADEGDEDGEDEGQEPGEDKPPRHGKRSWQKRVDKLTRRNGELERTLAEERGRRLALEELATKRGAEPPAEPPAPDVPEEPQPEDFDTVEDYAKAYAKWEREAEGAQAPKASEPNQTQAWAPSNESLELRTKSFQAAKSVFEDVEERLDKVGPSISVPMLKAVEFDEDGATILAHLADHPDELKRIAALTDEAQVSKALQRFAGKVLSAAPASTPPAEPEPDDGVTEEDIPRTHRQPKAVLSRAQPVGTVLRGSRVASEPDLESMDQAEYEAYMNKRSRGW